MNCSNTVEETPVQLIAIQNEKKSLISLFCEKISNLTFFHQFMLNAAKKGGKKSQNLR